ncbi:LysR family transcriptional regulator [Endozoicomonas sp. (ex Bugula neritina AB1)]|nr:LysR family transcriptional regulator [Endozoicomonas sp. (ex Bugula neritina AB1)]
MKFDLNLITVFLEVYRFHSYTKASEALGISQPAVSAAIKRLESSVGDRLFILEGRRMKPTAMAMRLADRFESGLHEIHNALSDRFTYTIYLSEALSFRLPTLPGIVFRQTPVDQDDLIESIRNLSVDFAVGIFYSKNHSIVLEPLFKEDVVVVCRKNHPRIQGSISRKQFSYEEHVTLSTIWNGLHPFEHISLESDAVRKVTCKTDSLAGILLQVASSNRIAHLSRHLVNQWKDILNLQVLESPIEHKSIEYQLAYHRKYQKSPAHLKMRDDIKRLLIEKNASCFSQ